MMTLQEAIAHAKEVAKDMKLCCEECAKEHEQLAEWLEELKQRREADRWIPVSERLPEPRVAVMVYCPEHKNQYCAFYADKHWQVFGAYDTVWDEVTYWKPLPKFYESEAENEQD